MVTERFAPSPTGLLHLGHAFSAWVGWHGARAAGGRFLLRLEDLDAQRVREEHAQAIFRDLRWLGIDWDGAVLRQSARLPAYEAALARLSAAGLTYACACTRRDIAEAVAAPQEGAAPAHGPDGLVYPGTCRGQSAPPGTGHALRLDIARALDHLGAAGRAALGFVELCRSDDGATGQIAVDRDDLVRQTGDIVLRRRDGAMAYHLAVVVDDAHQGVTHVTRGRDLFPATPVQVLLQALLGLPTPLYRHHRLIRDETGRRLAKRDDARAIAAYREAGLAPGEVLALAGVSDPRA